jgi:uncharacterized protein (TIGR01777 family)
MNFLIAGGSGFVGTNLSGYLKKRNHQVAHLVRRKARDTTEIEWRPEEQFIPETAFSDIDVVVNLSGVNISDWLWTPKFKQALYESRIKPTRTLARALSKLEDRKRVLLSISGVGIYGAATFGRVTEESKISNSFFSKLAQSWELESQTCASSNLRVANLRMSMVLGESGGVVKKLAPLFKLGLGAKIGDGKNHVSWISIDDVCRVIEFVASKDDLSGPINVVNPDAVTGDKFYTDLGKAYDRSVMFRIPAFIFKTFLGELAAESILSDQQIYPKKLLEAGFNFQTNSIEDAVLCHEL